MTPSRRFALAVLTVIAILSIAAPWLAPAGYEAQDRDAISQPPSRHYLLGTDELGRDNLARLLTGLRMSLALAAGGAAFSCLLALLIGAASGLAGGWLEQFVGTTINVFDSVPWIFLFLTVRALLPLNVSPLTSIWITFAMLALLGWTHAARVTQSAAAELRNSGAILYARACGIGGWRLWIRQTFPALRSQAITQFLLLAPTFVLAEAGLGLLGLGVSEPLPSMGNLLHPLQSGALIRSNPVILVPLGVLILLMMCFRLLCGEMEANS